MSSMENERRIMRGVHAVLPGRGFDPSELMPPGQAIIAYLTRAEIAAPGEESVALDDAAGRFLARAVFADRNYPVAARSTMDGFAVRSADTPGKLHIAADVPMGKLYDRGIGGGESARIPTGGFLPTGADTVVPIEQAHVDGDFVEIAQAVPAHECLTQPGDDMKEGEAMLQRGRRIGPSEISVLATLGIARVAVYRKPRVGILSSGDELVSVGESAGAAQIRDSNRYALAASLRGKGCEAVAFPTVSDRPGALERAMGEALPHCDALVLSGGSSVGTGDLTPGAINNLGEPGVVIHGLRVKPGKPTVLALLGRKPVIGLPGNPTSALLILEAVIAPVIAALTGSTQRALLVSALLDEGIVARAGWTWYVPVSLRDDGERYLARCLAIRSSSASLPARAAGFLTIGEDVTEIARGAAVNVQPLMEGLI
ncbi:MAG: gephyrin-like molybdotransferase Glp [Candidatus Baltobacteraceae bacterium]